MSTVPIYLPPNEWKLVAALLKMAGEQFDNHGCNDLPEDLIELLPKERWHKIAGEMEECTLEETEPGVAHHDARLMDYYGMLIDEAMVKDCEGET